MFENKTKQKADREGAKAQRSDSYIKRHVGFLFSSPLPHFHVADAQQLHSTLM